MKMKLSCLLAVYCGLLFYAAGAELTPLVPGDWFGEPGKPLLLRLGGNVPALDQKVELYDFAGQKIQELSLMKRGTECCVGLPAGLPTGFYTLAVGNQQRFGLLIQESFKGTPDRFYGIDAFLSWNNITNKDRYEYLKLLRRYGVACVRDRNEWSNLHPEPQMVTFKNGSPYSYPDRRRYYPLAGVELLDVIHGAPEWLRQSRLYPFPEDLVAAASSWTMIGAGMKQYLESFEYWNEPDAGYGAQLPADQFVPGLKAVYYGLKQSVPEVKYVIPSGPNEYNQVAAAGDALNYADAVVAHWYGDATEIPREIWNYREFLAAHGHEGMPIWATEVGQASWDQFRDPESVRKMAAIYAMQATIYKAIGVERIYSFCLLSLGEGDKTFGFIAADRTPRAIFAAFLANVRLLGNTHFRGMLEGVTGKVKSARVFSGSDREIVVWESSDHPQPICPPFAIRRAFGLDGRELKVQNNRVQNPDAVVYLETERLPNTLLNVHSLDNKLLLRAAVPEVKRQPVSPVIAYPRPNFQSIVRYSPLTNYTIADNTPAPVELKLFNLSGTEQKVTLQVRTELALTQGKRDCTLNIAPYKTVSVPFAVIMSSAQRNHGGYYDLAFQIKGNGFTDHSLVRFKSMGDNLVKLTVPRSPGAWTYFGGVENYRILIVSQPRVNREDLDGSFRCYYSPDALTIEAEVTDNCHFCEFEPTETWLGDSLQIAIQFGTPKTFDDRNRFVEYTIAKTPKGNCVFRKEKQSDGHWDSHPSALPLEITRTGIKTFYKFTISAADLGVKKIASGDLMRMSLLLNDNDGHGRRICLIWGDGIHPDKRPEEFNLVSFQ